MVIIFSEINDQPTSIVINWLKKYGVEYLRINYSDFFANKTLNIEFSPNFKYVIDGKEISLTTITGVWFRRVTHQKLSINYIKNDGFVNSHEELYDSINSYLLKEQQAVLDSFKIYCSQATNIIGNNNLYGLNKIDQIRIANEVGLTTPNSIVSNNYDELFWFSQSNSSLITKPISNIHSFNYEGNLFTPFTTNIKSNEIDKKNTSTNFFQNKIDKKYEIRSFFLDGKSYSMAIFDNDSETDYRVNQYTGTLSMSKYQLPVKIEQKCMTMMNHYNLNCCSIDFLVNEKEEIIFLEINPIGQFGFLSYPNNYNLEKIIALKLCQK